MKESEKAQSEGKIKKEELSIPEDRKQEKKPQEEKNQEEKIQEEKIQEEKMPEKKIQDDKIREIPAKAYAENRELTGIVIPEGVEIIGEKAFYFCTGLKTVTFPKSLREIRGEAFSKCRSLKEIVIPDGVSVMEPEAFSWCEGLERVRLPESLVWLEKRVFLNCSNLKEVWIPSGVKMIGQEAFWGCTRLCRIRLPERTVWVLPSAFDKCGQLPGEFLWQLQENSRNYPLPDCGGKERFSFGGFSFYVEKQQDLPGSGGGFWLGEQRYTGMEELLFNKERTLAQEMELRRDIYGRRVLRFRTSIPTFDSADRMYDSYRELDILILEKHIRGWRPCCWDRLREQMPVHREFWRPVPDSRFRERGAWG